MQAPTAVAMEMTENGTLVTGSWFNVSLGQNQSISPVAAVRAICADIADTMNVLFRRSCELSIT